jgi:CRP/FNR family cyclic AMP-dependent transcriptional regulator
MHGRPYGFDLFDSCATCTWREDSFFCNLDHAALEAFDAIAYTNAYPEGAVLFSEGQEPRGTFLICHGSAKLSISSADGRTLITRIARAGEVLGLSSSLSGHPYKATAEILEPSQVNFVRREDFHRLLASHPSAYPSVVLQLSAECEADADHIRVIELSHSAAEKLANLILSWCTNEESSQSCRCQMLLTHEDVAQLIGTSRETVTRLFKDFREQKLISMKGATLTVHDIPALRAMVSV